LVKRSKPLCLELFFYFLLFQFKGSNMSTAGML
jgi:hypothetical protein